MAINLTTLFTDLGKCMAAFVNVNGFAGIRETVPAAKYGAAGPVVKPQGVMYSDILTRLDSAGMTSLIPPAASLPALLALDSTLSAVKTALITDATSILVKRVNNDVGQNQATLQLAMIEVIRQMQSGSASVAACTVSATTTAGAGNTGNATAYASLYDPNGLVLENSLAETIILRCTQDENHGGTAGSESLSVTSPAQVSTTSSYLWPGGSGLSTTTTVVDPEQGNSGGQNLLTGSLTTTTVGAFKAWAGGLATGWTVDVDAANITDGTSSAYAGEAHCLKLTGNTAGTNLQTAIYQSFANGGVSAGSTQTLLPGSIYHFYCKIKADVVPAAGAVSFSLTDSAGTVINNNAGTANTIVKSISGIGGTSYVSVTGSFQTPVVMPENVRLRIKATTPITTGSNVFIDYVALTQPQASGPAVIGSGNSSSGYGGLYAGGPYLSVFRGSVDLVNWVSPTIGDTWSVAIANNYGSTSPTPLSFQTLFNLFFGTASLGLILPSVGGGAETIPNSLIA